MAVKFGKMVIIGAGFVGSAVLNAVLRMGIVNTIVVVDTNENKALGETLDASHTTAFVFSPNVTIRVGDYSDCADAQIIIMTAGPSIKPGATDGRMVLLRQNTSIMRDVMGKIASVTKDAVVIIVSNPVDNLVYAAQSGFGYPREKIIGTGTLVDSARFNKILGDICGVDAKNVNGFVLGEHGEHGFVPWNTVNVAGIPFLDLPEKFGLDGPLDKEKLLAQVKGVGFDILELKGYTSSGVALSACRIAASVIHNERCVLPLCVTLSGQYGIDDVAFSMPCVLSENGVDRVLEFDLEDAAREALFRCAAYLRDKNREIA